MRRRARRALLIGGALLLAFMALGLIALRLLCNGRNLATLIEERLNARIAGRVELDSVEWPFWALVTPFRMPLTVRGLKAWDGETKVMDVAYAEVTMDVWEVIRPALLRPKFGDLRVLRAKVKDGFAHVELYPNPEPDVLHPFRVGFLHAFAPKEHRHLHDPAPAGPIYALEDITLENVDVNLYFPKWRAELRGADLDGGKLLLDARDPTRFDFLYMLAPRIREAELVIAGQTFQLRDLVARKYGQYPEHPEDMAWDVTAHTVEGAAVLCSGRLTDLYNPDPRGGGVHDFLLRVAKAGPLAQRFTEDRLSGTDLQATLTIDGDYATGLELRLLLEKLDLTRPLAAHVPRLEISYRPLKRSGTIHDALVETLDGAVRVAGGFAFDDQGKPSVDLGATIAPDIDVETFLRPEVQKLAGTKAGGKLTLTGSLDDVRAELVAHLGIVALSGDVRVRDGVLSSKGLTVSAPELSAEVRGDVDLRRRRLGLAYVLDVSRIGSWLERLQRPSWARAARLLAKTSGHGTGTLSGPFEQPDIDAEVAATGLPVLDQATALAQVTWRPAFIELKELRATLLGGHLAASGGLRLGQRPNLVGLRLTGSGLDLAKAHIPKLEGLLRGKADLRLKAQGWLLRPRGDLELTASGLTLLEEPMGDLKAAISADDQGISIVRFEASRSGAKRFTVAGRLGYDKSLDLDVAVHRLTLGMLPSASRPPESRLSGFVSLALSVGGTTSAPSPRGILSLARVAVADTLLGGGRMTVEDACDSAKAEDRVGCERGHRIRVAGPLFQGKLQVEASASLQAPHDVRTVFAFKQLELEELTSVLADRFGIRGWISGAVELRWEEKLTVTAELSELHLEIDGHDTRGFNRPVAIENLDPVFLSYDGVTTKLTQPAKLTSPTGNFTLEGRFRKATDDLPALLDLALAGEIELGLLELIGRERLQASCWIERAHGVATVDLAFKGEPKAPRIAGSVVLRDATIRPCGQDAEIMASGTLSLSNDALATSGMKIVVDGETLMVAGTVGLDTFVPTTVNGEVHGRVAARLLPLLAPEYVAAAGGSAAVSLNVHGQAKNPDVDGTLTFDRELMASPRRLRREVALSRGEIRFTNQEVYFKGVRGRVDEARLSIDGAARFFGLALVDMDLRLAVEGLVHQIPGVLSLEANLDVRLSGDADELQLRGDHDGAGLIEIIDGRYYERFRQHEEAFIPERTSERQTPFWEGSPLLENLRLNLTLATRGDFAVNNNVGQDIAFQGSVRISGTPPDPRFDGRVTASGGRIKVPLTRPVFNLSEGSISFSPYEPLLSGAIVNVQADTDFTDANERTHRLHLALSGPLQRMKVDLKSDTGLNFGQTLLLILTGQTVDELRQKARGQADPGVPREATGGVSTIGAESSTVALVDQAMKEVLSDLIADRLETPLKDLTGLDCVQVKVGYASTMLYICEKLGRSFMFELELEQGHTTDANRQRGGFNWKLPWLDDSSLILDLQRREAASETDPVELRRRLQLKYRWEYP